jgi:hypothetical protein
MPDPYASTFEETPGYLHARVVGARTPDNLLRFFREVRETSARLGQPVVLMEMELTGPSLDIATIFGIISKSSSEGARLKQIAYVEARPANPDAAKFAATVAANRGVNIRLFGDVDSAVGWLLHK